MKLFMLFDLIDRLLCFPWPFCLIILKKLMLRGSHLFLLAHQPFKITHVSYVDEVLKDSMTKETPGAS